MRALAPASLKTSIGTTTASNGVPEATLAMMLGVVSKWIASLWPLAFSNCGASSLNRGTSEPPATTLISAALRSVADDIASTRPSIDAAAAGKSIFMIPPVIVADDWKTAHPSVRDRDIGDKQRLANGLTRERRPLLEPGTRRRRAP